MKKHKWAPDFMTPSRVLFKPHPRTSTRRMQQDRMERQRNLRTQVFYSTRSRQPGMDQPGMDQPARQEQQAATGQPANDQPARQDHRAARGQSGNDQPARPQQRAARGQPGHKQPPRPQQRAATVLPIAEVISLREELKAAKQTNVSLAAENTNLRRKNTTLEKDNRQLRQDNEGLKEKMRRLFVKARGDIVALEQELKDCRAGQERSNKILQEKDLEISQLQATVQTQKEEAGQAKESFIKERGQMIASFQAEVQNIKTLCGTISEQSEVIISLKEELKTFSQKVNSLSSQLQMKQQDLEQNVTRSKALERELLDVLASREEAWRTKEEALLKKVSDTEEELRLAIIKSIGLQESALKTKKSKKQKKRRKTEEVKEVKEVNEVNEVEEVKEGNEVEAVEEAPVPLPEAKEEEETVEGEKKKKRRWFWGKKKKRSLSSSRVEEEAVCPTTSGQQ